MTIGTFLVLKAELWAILKGFSICWDVGQRNIIVKTNSMLVVKMLNNQTININNQWALCSSIKTLIARPWMVSFVHTYREGNQVTDNLSKMGDLTTYGTVKLDHPPS